MDSHGPSRLWGGWVFPTIQSIIATQVVAAVYPKAVVLDLEVPRHHHPHPHPHHPHFQKHRSHQLEKDKLPLLVPTMTHPSRSRRKELIELVFPRWFFVFHHKNPRHSLLTVVLHLNVFDPPHLLYKHDMGHHRTFHKKASHMVHQHLWAKFQ